MHRVVLVAVLLVVATLTVLPASAAGTSSSPAGQTSIPASNMVFVLQNESNQSGGGAAEKNGGGFRDALGDIIDKGESVSSGIEDFVESKITELVIRPVVTGVLIFAQTIARYITLITLGPNFEIGVVSGYPGLADLPLFAVKPLISAGDAAGSAVLTALTDLNKAMADAAAQAGIAGPPIYLGAWAVEIGVAIGMGNAILSSLPVAETATSIVNEVTSYFSGLR